MDIFIGALDENLLTKRYLIASHSYYHDYLIWCVQKANVVPVWDKILYVCTDPVVFVIFTLHAIIITGVVYFIQQFERHTKWDLFRISVNGFQCYMGSGCTYKPKNFSNRVVSAAVFLGCVLFNTILCTKIMMFYTSPIQDTQIKSTEGIISGGFQLMADCFTYQKMLQQNQVTKAVQNEK